MLVAIRRVHSTVVAMLFIYTNCVLELRGQQRTSRIAAGENCASTYGRICDAFCLDYHLSVLDNPVGDVREIVQIDNCKSAYPGGATGSKSNFRRSSGYSLVPISMRVAPEGSLEDDTMLRPYSLGITGWTASQKYWHRMSPVLTTVWRQGPVGSSSRTAGTASRN